MCALVATACGSSAPAAPSSASSASRFQTTGRLIDALSSAAVSGVTPASSETRTIYTAPTDANGAFTLAVDTAATGPLSFSFSGPSIVTRQTLVKVPGDAVTITTIPKTFELAAFDELCRSTEAKLMRWTTAPPLVVESRVLQFTSATDTQFTATSEAMSDAEASGLIADLTWALPQMTGSQFAGFASTPTRTTSAVGASVTMIVTGQITVGRFAGLAAATGSVGMSRWVYRTDGVVVGGIVMLDNDFDKSAVATVRAVRTHELGHALGYSHVNARDSVMNPLVKIEPNAGDLAATRLAFMRPPGNMTPDIDPSGYSTNRVRLTWTAPIR
jgi:hypothetical protein